MLNWLEKLLRASSPRPSRDEQLRALLGQALASRRDRIDEAERYLYRALALAPDSAEVHLQLGDLFRELGRHGAALGACEEAVRCAPGSAQAHNNLGNALRALGREQEAVGEFRRAIALDAGLPEPHFNLGLCLHKQGDTEHAARCYAQALRLNPAFGAAQLNLGFLREEGGDVAGALAAYAGAVAADATLVEAHVNLGMQLLLAGRLAEGWEEFEWRLRYPEYSGADAAVIAPRWDGSALNGRTILLDAEQGFGDALQFLRYAPLVAGRGGRVIVRCASELRDLVAGTAGVTAVVRRGEPLPVFDAYCPLPSLPRTFGTTLANVPAAVPYVRAESGGAARWRARFADAATECRVGLVWASQSGHRTAAAKSLALAALAPLGGVPGVRFYSLQKGEAARQVLQPPAGLSVTDLSGELADFADTAGAIAGLDLVISVDTAVAHLAGAMAMPTWTLLKYVPDWRWLLGRGDCPWYPTMRLFRQERQGDWQVPVAAMAAALREFVAARTPARR